MNRCSKKWLLAAAILVAVGAAMFVGGLAAMDFEINRLSTQKFQTNTYEFDEDFENISIHVETAAVNFVPSEEGVCRIECLEEERLKHSAAIRNGTLTIDAFDSRKWYDHVGISFQTPEITVFLPKDAYSSLFVETKTGNVEIPDRYSFETVVMAGSTSNIACYASVSKNIAISTTTGKIALGSSETEMIQLSASTGDITLHDVVCEKLTVQNSTGQIHLKNVIAKDSITAENTTGGVSLDGCDAADITVKTSTGSVKGTLLSEKIFMTDTSTGSVRVPQTTGGGKCEITTNTGDIQIEIA